MCGAGLISLRYDGCRKGSLVRASRGVEKLNCDVLRCAFLTVGSGIWICDAKRMSFLGGVELTHLFTRRWE